MMYLDGVFARANSSSGEVITAAAWRLRTMLTNVKILCTLYVRNWDAFKFYEGTDEYKI